MDDNLAPKLFVLGCGCCCLILNIGRVLRFQRFQPVEFFFFKPRFSVFSCASTRDLKQRSDFDEKVFPSSNLTGLGFGMVMTGVFVRKAEATTPKNLCGVGLSP